MPTYHSELLTGLLLNLLVILIMILLISFQYLSRNKVHKLHIKPLSIYVACSLLLLLSLALSVRLEDGFVYDLRFIPFLLGGIYGGNRVLPWLAVTMIAVRVPMLGPGLVVTIIMAILFTFVIMYMRPRLEGKDWKARVYWYTLMSFGYSVLSLLIPSLVFDFDYTSSFLVYSAVLSGSTFFVFYLCEIIRTIYTLQLEAIKYEKMQVVSHLAASMSHEVRNPLTTVKGFLQLIQEDPSNVSINSELSKVAVSEIDRATEVINQYLNFARPHPELEVEVEIRDEINRSTEIIMPLAVKKGIVLKANILHHHSIIGDPNKLQQVLINVMKNGLEAMETGGTLRIFSYQEGDRVFIVINDTGTGMTKEQLMRLGEPYFSMKGKNGTGLGMMTVFQLVEGMKGTIKVLSKPGKGTSVILSFPIYKEEGNLNRMKQTTEVRPSLR
ncbi:HAMP domain-containing sensor histidine kinase [Rossellomorea aquimaris]|uniref:histidine kinase n=1 Tax=Rossellomorea aquimaris TaxID=189382 RepID=A0A366EEI3_9BACI|nr:HAMP domain-containing sensor histidine kinase [Rossellomorea aquimaris]RBP00821.1 two-component system sporulation sensor kinase B [Rossellomorea aquimaris]